MSDIEAKSKDNFQVVFSYQIATSLVADLPFFVDLVSIQKSKKYRNHRVWIFKKSPEFIEAFEQLKAEAIQRRQARDKEIRDFDKDVVVSE